MPPPPISQRKPFLCACACSGPRGATGPAWRAASASSITPANQGRATPAEHQEEENRRHRVPRARGRTPGAARLRGRAWGGHAAHADDANMDLGPAPGGAPDVYALPRAAGGDFLLDVARDSLVSMCKLHSPLLTRLGLGHVWGYLANLRDGNLGRTRARDSNTIRIPIKRVRWVSSYLCAHYSNTIRIVAIRIRIRLESSCEDSESTRIQFLRTFRIRVRIRIQL